MATIGEIRTALGTKLSTISGVHVRDFLPDQIVDPLITITPTSINYHGAMQGGLIEVEFRVLVVVSRVSERVAQTRLDAFASYSGASSVRAAIEADPSLGGVVEYAQVVGTTDIATADLNGAVYLVMDYTVAVQSR
jgi:hypothetical protein